MTEPTPVIDIRDLVRRYGRTDAVDGLNLRVQAGRCYGFFGRNGAGKTTTIKCLLNLLRPTRGVARVFGLDPEREEVAVKSRLSYVPDAVAFYPWMTIRQTLDYCASFRTRWNDDTERALVSQFRLDRMTTTAVALPPGLVKEVRALFPTFVVILVAIVAGSFGHSFTLVAAGLLAYAFGTVALGAQSFGHEYSHRTLGLLLSQPVHRRQLYVYKLAVLSVMLVTLSAAALLLFSDLLKLARSPHTEPSMLVLAAACGLCIAPFLALLCRSTLAAVVFTIAIPGLLAAGADVLGGLIYGTHNAAAIDRFTLAVFWRGMYLICGLSAIAGWWTFMRLEAIAGHADVQLPELLQRRRHPAAAASRRQRHPVSALVRKELRLQQMAFAVAAVYVALWLALAWLEERTPDASSRPVTVLTMLYGGMLAILVGSLASAEERQLGTLEWQTLQPIRARQQWAVKAAATYGLALLLGVGLPALLQSLGLSKDAPGVALSVRTVPLFLLLTTVSMYLSTLCRSAMSALVLSFPTVVATVLFVQVAGAQFVLMSAAARERRQLNEQDALLLMVAVGAGLGALLLWLAFNNHRSADRSTARTVTQMIGLASYTTAGLAILIILGVR